MDLFNKKKIKELNEKIINYQVKVTEFKVKEKDLIEKVDSLEKISEHITKENQKLISWIENILEQFGTMEMPNRQQVHIPIYKMTNDFMYEPNPNTEFTRMSCKTIVIPEIIINKYEDRR